MGHSVMKRAAPPVEETILVIRVMGLVAKVVTLVTLGISARRYAALCVETTLVVRGVTQDSEDLILVTEKVGKFFFDQNKNST